MNSLISALHSPEKSRHSSSSSNKRRSVRFESENEYILSSTHEPSYPTIDIDPDLTSSYNHQTNPPPPSPSRTDSTSPSPSLTSCSSNNFTLLSSSSSLSHHQQSKNSIDSATAKIAHTISTFRNPHLPPSPKQQHLTSFNSIDPSSSSSSTTTTTTNNDKTPRSTPPVVKHYTHVKPNLTNPPSQVRTKKKKPTKNPFYFYFFHCLNPLQWCSYYWNTSVWYGLFHLPPSTTPLPRSHQACLCTVYPLLPAPVYTPCPFLLPIVHFIF